MLTTLGPSSRPPALHIALSLAAVLLIAFLDAVTGWDLSLYLFYAGPILYAAWYTQSRWAVFLAVFSGLAWSLANYRGHRFETDVAYFWAGFNRMVYFVLVAIGGIAFRRSQAEVRGRMEAMERARELEKEIVRVSENEQMRLGRDLHDGVCQSLAAIHFAADCLKGDLAERGLPEAEDALKLQEMLQRTMVEARSLARGVFPLEMDSAGLTAALSELAGTMERVYSVPIHLEIEPRLVVPTPEVGMNIYRLVQEALSNAVRHSGATRVRIALTLSEDAQRLRMEVIDNGEGFSPGASSGGMGLRTMRYRAELMGGRLEILSNDPQGTVIRCSVPLRGA